MLPRRLLWLCIALGAGLGVGQGAWAQSANWARYALISPTTTLSAGRLCYTDGVGIACDSSAPLASGLSLGDRITSGTTEVVTNNGGPVSVTVAGSNIANFGAGGLGITAINASGLLQSAGVSSSAGISGTTGYFSGNVGIGTTSLNGTLNLANSSQAEITFVGTASNGNIYQAGAGRSLYINTQNGPLILGVNGNGSGQFVISPTGNVGINMMEPAANLQISGSLIVSNTIGNANPALFVSGTTGRVGLGTLAPSVTLHIVGTSSNNVLRLTSTSGKNMLDVNTVASAPYLSLFKTDGSVGSYINTSGTTYFAGGDVGIGTTAPTAALEVSGTFRISGTVAASACATASDIGKLRTNNGDLEVCSPYPP